MAQVYSFAPIADADARILILGSMPGVASLTAGQYYAHPRNSFWKILGELLGFESDSVYDLRVLALQSAGIAIWDVLYSCYRQGSADAMIEQESLLINDFKSFFESHANIRWVFFNGRQAENFYKRLVIPDLPINRLVYNRLPSTSPAYAALNFTQKLSAWRVLAECLAIADSESVV